MAHQHNWNRVSEAWVHCMACDNWKSNSNKKGTTMTHTTEPTIDDLEQEITNIFITIDNYGTDEEARVDIRKLISDQVAKAKLEAFDVAFDCHDYDRLRAYRAKLLKEVK